jgi:TatD DNase family protein
LALIKAHGKTESAGVLHCFTEDWDMAKRAIDLNYMISISGIITFNNASALRDVVRQIPLDRLLVETDSPYLAPVPHRGKPNEPAFVREVCEYIAELKGVSYSALAEQTGANFHKLFNKAV